jgi:hypothetical protein
MLACLEPHASVMEQAPIKPGSSQPQETVEPKQGTVNNMYKDRRLWHSTSTLFLQGHGMRHGSRQRQPSGATGVITAPPVASCHLDKGRSRSARPCRLPDQTPFPLLNFCCLLTGKPFPRATTSLSTWRPCTCQTAERILTLVVAFSP